MSSGSWKMLFIDCIYKSDIYIEDSALNNLQGLICHKTKPNQIIYIYIYICIKMIWHQITYKGWYTIKPNQTKSYIFDIYV